MEKKYVLFFDIINGFFLSDSCDDYADEENGIFVDVLDEDTFIDTALDRHASFDEDRLSCAEVSIESIRKIFDADYSISTFPGSACIKKEFFERQDEDETEAEKNA